MKSFLKSLYVDANVERINQTKKRWNKIKQRRDEIVIWCLTDPLGLRVVVAVVVVAVVVVAVVVVAEQVWVSIRLTLIGPVSLPGLSYNP